MKEIAARVLRDSAELKQLVADTLAADIAAAGDSIAAAYQANRKLIAMGNGGSAADAQHLVAELVGRFIADRPALAAVCLSDNASSVTSIANDYGYDSVFARQVEAHARPGDVVVGISTSGNSPNVLRALKRAREIGARTVGLSGRDGGHLREAADICITVPHRETARVQEVHITIIHIWCEILERKLFRPR